MYDLLVINANLVNENTVSEQDILIKNKRIEEIGNDLQHKQAKQIINAEEKFLIPGMIDDQVHFREPGLTHKADMMTESHAAVAGGITSFMDMPNVKPPTLSLELLEQKYQAAHGRAQANYAFYMGASNNNLEVIKSIPKNLTCGVKVFMGDSTGDMLVNNEEVLDGIFKYAPVPVITHCEDSPLIEQNLKQFQKKYGDDIPIEYHPIIRSEEACYKSSLKAVQLAKQHGTQLHVLHISTAKELELFIQGEVQNKSITAEVCVHYLFFNSTDYAEKGSLIKCNPSIKTLQDQQRLLQGVNQDQIDIIATDHAPHLLEEKKGNYLTSPAGLPLVQHALLSLLEHYHDNALSMEKIVEKTSHNVATRFSIVNRGFIREGYFADLAIIDTDKTFAVTSDNVLYKCGWSPFEGYTFRSTIDTTVLNGQVVYERGKFINTSFCGERLIFNR